jgi:hypothetical protein
MSLLWALLPDEFMPLAIAGIGLALILGFIGLRKAATLIGGICLLLISAPFFDALFDALPGWLFLLMLPILAIMVIRWLVRLVIGERAADHLVGSLAADVCRAVFLLPFRVLGLLFRRR